MKTVAARKQKRGNYKGSWAYQNTYLYSPMGDKIAFYTTLSTCFH